MSEIFILLKIQSLKVPTRDMVQGRILSSLSREGHKARGTGVRGQEKLSLQSQKTCKTLVWAHAESCESVSLGILKKSKIRYMSQVVQVSAFQHFF